MTSLAVEKKKQSDIVLKNLKSRIELAKQGKINNKDILSALEPLAMDLFEMYNEGGHLKDLPTPPPYNCHGQFKDEIFTFLHYVKKLNMKAVDYDKEMKERNERKK